MCLRPLQIYRFNPVLNASVLDTVPCGRCVECLANKRSQFAAQSVIEAKKFGKLFLCTFTYDNEHIPLKYTARLIQDGEIVELYPSKDVQFEDRSKYISLMVDSYRNSNRFRPDYPNSLNPISFPIFESDDGSSLIDVQVTPSLDRVSFRNWLKAYRVRYKRKYGFNLPKTFKYTFFGEYGDWSSRPHFHAVFTGLSVSQLADMQRDFRCYFGNLDYRSVLELNPDGSPGFIKASKYISKYIAKQELSLSDDLNGYVERPRKCSSRSFGRLDEVSLNKYRAYFLGFDFYRYDPDNPNIPDDKRETLLQIINQRKHCFIIDGCKFSTPQYILREIFYKRVNRDFSQRFFTEACKSSVPWSIEDLRSVRHRYVYKPRKIQTMAVDFARNSYNSLFMRQLQEYADLFGQNLGLACKKLTAHESSLYKDRADRAESYYINSLKSQHYA